MAVYKVPQDVEAEDKLIGPFGFRQFIYLIIVAFACFVAYILAQIFIGLILIPLPFILFFGAIALPLRKDQPTEVYLAAILQYHLKSKKRMWMPDGVLSTVEITAPKIIEVNRTKDISQDEALDRLGHLAQIMDTRGWAARGVFNPDINSTANVQLSDETIAAAATAPDIMDGAGISAQSFDKLIDEQKVSQRAAVVQRMTEAAPIAVQPTTPAQPPVQPMQISSPQTNTSQEPSTIAATTPPQPAIETDEERAFLASHKARSTPVSIHQKVIQPLAQAPEPIVTQQAPSVRPPSPDIIDLANNAPDLSIATIAKQVHRKEDERAREVEIKLH